MTLFELVTLPVVDRTSTTKTLLMTLKIFWQELYLRLI